MTVATPNLALLDLGEDLLPWNAPPEHSADVLVLQSRIDVVELKDGDVCLATVNARVLLQVCDERAQHERVLGPTPSSSLAYVVLTVPRVVESAICATALEADGPAA